jgi:hypothetical protein
MTPYYPARDGRPSIFGLEAATKLSPLGTVEATDERDAIAAYRHPLNSHSIDYPDGEDGRHTRSDWRHLLRKEAGRTAMTTLRLINNVGAVIMLLLALVILEYGSDAALAVSLIISAAFAYMTTH